MPPHGTYPGLLSGHYKSVIHFPQPSSPASSWSPVTAPLLSFSDIGLGYPWPWWMFVMLQSVHAHHDRQERLALIKPGGFQLRNEVSQPEAWLVGVVLWMKKERNEQRKVDGILHLIPFWWWCHHCHTRSSYGFPLDQCGMQTRSALDYQSDLHPRTHGLLCPVCENYAVVPLFFLSLGAEGVLPGE